MPVGGREAPLDRKQEYMTTVFEQEESPSRAELLAQIERFRLALEEIAYGSLGKSVAVKNIAKTALEKIS